MRLIFLPIPIHGETFPFFSAPMIECTQVALYKVVYRGLSTTYLIKMCTWSLHYICIVFLINSLKVFFPWEPSVWRAQGFMTTTTEGIEWSKYVLGRLTVPSTHLSHRFKILQLCLFLWFLRMDCSNLTRTLLSLSRLGQVLKHWPSVSCTLRVSFWVRC